MFAPALCAANCEATSRVVGAKAPTARATPRRRPSHDVLVFNLRRVTRGCVLVLRVCARAGVRRQRHPRLHRYNNDSSIDSSRCRARRACISHRCARALLLPRVAGSLGPSRPPLHARLVRESPVHEPRKRLQACASRASSRAAEPPPRAPPHPASGRTRRTARPASRASTAASAPASPRGPAQERHAAHQNHRVRRARTFRCWKFSIARVTCERRGRTSAAGVATQ